MKRSERILSVCVRVLDCDITERSKTNDMAYKRYIFFALCRYLDESISLSEMGRVCGGRGHATVINGLKVFYDVVVENEYYWGLYQKCLECIEQLETDEVKTDSPMESILRDHIILLKKEVSKLKGRLYRIKKISSL